MTASSHPAVPASSPTAAPESRDLLRDVRPGDRWLVAVAHPDDESFGCGSVIAAAATRGAAVTVACATRGESGVPARPIDGDDLGAVREAELHRAAARLGAARAELLGWRDSGFDGEPPAGSLCAVPEATVVGTLERLLRDVRPDVTVVLDGSDGHRDHQRMRTATATAARRAARNGSPTRLYEHCLPNSLMRRWLDETSASRGDDAYHGLDPATLGRPDAEITDVLDAGHVLERREAAIAEHRSQTSPFDGLSDELRRAYLTVDHLRAVPLADTAEAASPDRYPRH
jgi:N-acetyl-1-D-myo-inositol-2-amino-2-deoxy-alpha-D-glucopyranoside deacetylase